MRHGKVMPYEISDQLLFYLFRDYIYILYIYMSKRNKPTLVGFLFKIPNPNWPMCRDSRELQ